MKRDRLFEGRLWLAIYCRTYSKLSTFIPEAPSLPVAWPAVAVIRNAKAGQQPGFISLSIGCGCFISAGRSYAHSPWIPVSTLISIPGPLRLHSRLHPFSCDRPGRWCYRVEAKRRGRLQNYTASSSRHVNYQGNVARC